MQPTIVQTKTFVAFKCNNRIHNHREYSIVSLQLRQGSELCCLNGVTASPGEWTQQQQQRKYTPRITTPIHFCFASHFMRSYCSLMTPHGVVVLGKHGIKWTSGNKRQWNLNENTVLFYSATHIRKSHLQNGNLFVVLNKLYILSIQMRCV